MFYVTRAPMSMRIFQWSMWRGRWRTASASLGGGFGEFGKSRIQPQEWMDLVCVKL